MDLTVFQAWLSAKLNLRTRDERGANLVEYVLLLAFIAIVVFVAVKVLGKTVSTKFSKTDSALQ
jgi:Flp pilus assembly pilin Flp